MANQPKKIPGKVSIPGYNTEIDIDEVDDQYEAYDKGLPPDLPGYFNGEKITWFNNFGVKRKNNQGNEKKVPRYKVTLKKLPSGKRICIYDDTLPENERLVEVTSESGNGRIKYKDAGNGNISFYLDLGDPPAGMFP